MLGKKKLAVLTSFVIFSLGASFMGSFAWFANTVTLSKDSANIKGASMAGYFAYGDGSSDHPYGISIPRHLRNLAWLQYLGHFSNKQFCFELANSVPNTGLDMSSYGVLPPIGTEENPFVGKFNGNGKIIKGLKVSNDENVLLDEDNPHPELEESFTAPQIVGMFGVVGNLNGAYTGTYDSSINSIYNFGLTGATVYTVTQKALVGVLAGYSSGEVSNVAVNNSKINVGGATQAFDSANLTNNLSDHTLIGYTTKKSTISKLSESLYGVNVQQLNPFNATTDGSATGWGGSIAIKDIFERLSDIKSSRAKAASIPIAKTYNYDADGKILDGYPQTTKSYTSNNPYAYNQTTYKNGTTYNSKIGAVQYGNEQDGIFYLSGGHYSTKNYSTTGVPITDGTNFVAVTNNTISNNATIRNTQNSTEALLWGFENNRLVTRYNGTTYYLSRNNNNTYTDLRLKDATTYAPTFTREENNGYFRYTCTISNNKYYLKLNNGSWILELVPTVGTITPYAPMPSETISKPAGSRPTEPTIWRPTNDPGENSHYYYIYSGNNYFNSSGSNSTKSSTASTNSVYWDFGATLSSSEKTGTIKNVENSNDLYLNWYTIFIDFGFSISVGTSGNSNSWRTTLDTSTHIGRIRNANKTGRYLTYNNGWNQNDGTATVYIYSVHQAYLDWQNYDSLNIPWKAYDENQAAWAAYNSYTSSQATYIQQYNANIASYSLLDMQVNSTIGSDVYTYTKSYMDYSEQDATYFPLNVHEKDENGSLKNEPLDTNTGYIIGGSTFTSADDSYGNGNIRISSFYTISDSIRNFNNGKLSDVYTYDDAGLHVINDATQTYEKYISSKASVEEILSESSNVYGLHFMEATIDKNNCVNALYTMINGEFHPNYEMPANSIDFNLKEKGYINFFAGTYGRSNQTNATIDSFFSLHMIRRYTQNDEIPANKKVGDIYDIYEIEEVLTDNNKKHSYVYRLSNGKFTVPYSFDAGDQSTKYVLDTNYLITDTENGGYSDGHYHQLDNAPAGYNTVVFRTDWIKNHSYASGNEAFHKAFYFEIPMNQGEFALGSVSGKTYGAYLIYLDIGANAAKTNRTQITEKFEKTNNEYDYPLGVALTNPGSTVDEADSVCATISASFTGEMEISRDGTTVTITGIGGENATISPTYKGDNITTVKAPGGSNVAITPLRSTTEITKRMQFYDYNSMVEELTRTEITDVSTNGGTSYTRTINQYKVDETNDKETKVDNNKVKIYRSTNGAVYTTAEAMDQTDLQIALNNTAVVASFDYSGLNIDYKLYERLKMIVDPSNENGKYYKFDKYIVEVSVTSGTIIFTVTNKDANTTVYINSTELATHDPNNPPQSPQTVPVGA